MAKLVGWLVEYQPPHTEHYLCIAAKAFTYIIEVVVNKQSKESETHKSYETAQKVRHTFLLNVITEAEPE